MIQLHQPNLGSGLPAEARTDDARRPIAPAGDDDHLKCSIELLIHQRAQ